MATPVSLNSIAPVAENGMVRGADGYFDVAIETGIVTPNGEGKARAIIKRSDVSDISGPGDIENYTLSLGGVNDGVFYVPDNGMMVTMSIAVVSVYNGVMSLTMTADNIDALVAFRVDYIAVLQAIMPFDMNLYRGYLSGTKFFITVDYTPVASDVDEEQTVEKDDVDESQCDLVTTLANVTVAPISDGSSPVTEDEGTTISNTPIDRSVAPAEGLIDIET